MNLVLLADRIFGDKEKAKAWLNRPNPSLSGRRPIDLLEDEAGTAIVREILERIDHGTVG
jgi:putative toxin-antitoxin system antitoxin component (TIGR02293 family)